MLTSYEDLDHQRTSQDNFDGNNLRWLKLRVTKKVVCEIVVGQLTDSSNHNDLSVRRMIIWYMYLISCVVKMVLRVTCLKRETCSALSFNGIPPVISTL